MLNNKEVVDKLSSLVQTTKDGQAGFAECAEKAENSELKAFFSRNAARCQEGLIELERMVESYGGDANDVKGSILGSLHRGWIDLRTALSSHDDKVILEECESAEDSAMSAYRDILEIQDDLPPDVRIVVQRQFEGVKSNHDQIRYLRDHMN